MKQPSPLASFKLPSVEADKEFMQELAAVSQHHKPLGTRKPQRTRKKALRDTIYGLGLAAAAVSIFTLTFGPNSDQLSRGDGQSETASIASDSAAGAAGESSSLSDGREDFAPNKPEATAEEIPPAGQTLIEYIIHSLLDE